MEKVTTTVQSIVEPSATGYVRHCVSTLRPGLQAAPSKLQSERRAVFKTTQPRLFSSLRVYVGQTRSRELIEWLAAAGIGECVVRGQLPPRRGGWFYDNGAFQDWRRRRAFDYAQFSRDLRAIRMWQERGIGRGLLLGHSMTAPDFIVVPDLVGQGEVSLRFSLDHLDQTHDAGAPCYLAVQDGMTEAQVADILRVFPSVRGLFVGGTLRWKLKTAAAWCALGRRTNRPVHIGRVGTPQRIAWAQSIGATSIDSSFPLWQRARLASFIDAVT